eukprot:CAMPEP_0183594638 /NCGR_PEP_ID=MMETSP0371-20130417/172036_1 /TAXON_ID=268820 /ORGANISM="Peridinium aciculiferum, Strain PAER-2" /LENGTH=48 /DNA_ID= /DNA_START= /DNA_END= /DNA_ORIENTATION=
MRDAADDAARSKVDPWASPEQDTDDEDSAPDEGNAKKKHKAVAAAGQK